MPAPFRAALAEQSFAGIIAYGSFINPCIEACGIDRIEKLSKRIETLDPFSDEHDAFATTILGGSQQLGFDSEGRVMLSENLLNAAGLDELAVFVGKGETFEIWEPESFKTYAERARDLAREKRRSLTSGVGEGK